MRPMNHTLLPCPCPCPCPCPPEEAPRARSGDRRQPIVSSRPPELPDVVAGTHERPFTLRFDHAAHLKPPEPHCLLDLAEHGLRNALSPSIDLLPFWTRELGT